MNRFILRQLALSVLLFTLISAPAAIEAGPEKERRISFYHIHTKETISLTYKRDGRYLPKAMKSIDWFMRDWRQNTKVKIDPRAIDILWEMHTELGSKEPIHIICGYRSRKTNNMLRRSRGGQASNSLHITGKAIDAHFPDVPVRYVRYAGLVRQRGGVGYYPTSALPFVHVDTGRVRHWPRIKRDELALLFPNGRSKHVPRGGRRIRPSDVTRAQSRNTSLAMQVAGYFSLRDAPKSPTLIADAGIIKPPKPEPATRPASVNRPTQVAIATPAPAPRHSATPITRPKPLEEPTPWTVEVAPNMSVALDEPRPDKPATRVARFQPQPSETDRARLNRLIAQAMFLPLVEPPQLLRAAAPHAGYNNRRRQDTDPVTAKSGPVLSGEPHVIAAPEPITSNQPNPQQNRFDLAPGMVAVLDDRAWTSAPEYDDDHPDELAYRPFPIGPLMTASLDDPTLSRLSKPDNNRTLELLGETSSATRMQLRPPQQVAELMWRQEFSGTAVQLHNRDAATGDRPGLNPRGVVTSTQ